jgi:hypothetical protein
MPLPLLDNPGTGNCLGLFGSLRVCGPGTGGCPVGHPAFSGAGALVRRRMSG